MDNIPTAAILWHIAVTVAVTLWLIHALRGYPYARGLKLFVVLYLAGQAVGYGLGVEPLKAVIPSTGQAGDGVQYQIVTSTLLPMLVAFAVDALMRRVLRWRGENVSGGES